MTHAGRMKYPRQHPSDKPLTAAHTPSSRLLHCRFAFMDCDRCLQALCSQDRVWLPRPVQQHAQAIRSKVSRCWTWSLELARSYSDIIPLTCLDAQSVLVTEIWSSKDVYFCATAKTFLYSAGHTAEVELTFLHLRPLSSAVAIWARLYQALISGARCNAQG